MKTKRRGSDESDVSRREVKSKRKTDAVKWRRKAGKKEVIWWCREDLHKGKDDGRKQMNMEIRLTRKKRKCSQGKNNWKIDQQETENA